MNRHAPPLALAAALAFAGAQAADVTLTFNDLAEGATLSSQYAAQGVTFSANAFSGGSWATNTGMTVTGTDIPAFGGPSPVDGKLLHSYGNWLDENGNPSFGVSFAGGATAVSIRFIDVEEPDNTFFSAYNGSTLLGTVTASVAAPGGATTLSFTAPNITSLRIADGSFTDWVGVDSITVTLAPIPEPDTVVLLSGGLLVLGLLRLRRSGFRFLAQSDQTG